MKSQKTNPKKVVRKFKQRRKKQNKCSMGCVFKDSGLVEGTKFLRQKCSACGRTRTYVK